MIELDLTEEETSILKMVLESYLSDLRMEISHTDRLEFRDMLKERKAVLIKVIETLAPPG